MADGQPAWNIAQQLRGLLGESDDDLIAGMALLNADHRSRLTGCLAAVQCEAAVLEECQEPEVRYVSSSDQAVSGDEKT